MHACQQVDAGRVRRALSKRLFGRVVAASELVLLHVDDMAILVRVTAAHSLDEAAREEALSYHCFRGLIMPETVIWFAEEGVGKLGLFPPAFAAVLCSAAQPVRRPDKRHAMDPVSAKG